jgi:general secretion pathway protein A
MPLSRHETEDYVRHRLMVAGGEGKVTFSAGALSAVHGLSGGVPRLINLICDRALLAGYVGGTRAIDVAMVRRAAHEVRGEGAPRRLPRAGLAALLAAVAVLGVAGVVAARRPAAEPLPAPAPSVAAAAVTPVTTPPTVDLPRLEPLVLALDGEGSRRSAFAAAHALWGGAAVEVTPLRTHLEMVRRLDLPAVLELVHPARRDPCYVALVAMDENGARLSAGGTTLRVPIGELDRLWTRQAFFLWRDFESLSAAGPERSVDFARAHLARLGYLNGDGPLPDAVARFQHDAELAADGIVGARTLMALYSRSDYPQPRLSRRERTAS